MNTLSKMQAVMHRTSFQRDLVDRRSAVVFEAREDDLGTIEKEVSIELSAWQDMGEPDTITVTIEPGDRLNP